MTLDPHPLSRPAAPITLTIALILSQILAAPAQESAISSEGAAEWLEFYYLEPEPEKFVQRMRDWAADGTLENEAARPALIAFISQLIRANRNRLDEWYDRLRDLPPGQVQVLHTAMLLSRTGEADRIMKKRFGAQYEAQKKQTSKILDMPLDARPTIDMLWGFYYATGSAKAIRRVVLCFRLREAPANPEGVDIPEGYQPYYKVLPDIARASLLANAKRHPRVEAILETFYREDKSLVAPEKEGIREILAELNPGEYPETDGDDSEAPRKEKEVEAEAEAEQ